MLLMLEVCKDERTVCSLVLKGLPRKYSGVCVRI